MLKHWTVIELEAKDKLTDLYQELYVQTLGASFRQAFRFFKTVLVTAVGKRFERTPRLQIEEGNRNELEPLATYHFKDKG